jgi:hypothetical protein
MSNAADEFGTAPVVFIPIFCANTNVDSEIRTKVRNRFFISYIFNYTGLVDFYYKK